VVGAFPASRTRAASVAHVVTTQSKTWDIRPLNLAATDPLLCHGRCPSGGSEVGNGDHLRGCIGGRAFMRQSSSRHTAHQRTSDLLNWQAVGVEEPFH
jgi:hypothetical protein